MAIVLMYNKKRPLMKLEMEGKKVLSILEIDKKFDKFCPITFLGAKTSGQLLQILNHWIDRRLMPDTREGIQDVRNEFKNFEEHRCMFSLSDQYWFRHDLSETWEELNFFTNNYPDSVGKMFFSPWEVNLNDIHSNTPDLTTNGNLIKAWRKENGVDYLYKTRSSDGSQQPISEVLASILLEKIQIIPFVKYELDVYGLKLCSKCANFVNENTEFVPASHLYYLENRNVNMTRLEHLLKMCSKFKIEGVEDYLNKMIVADKIINNNDRHLGNFGFIRDVNTGKFIGNAPLFDSGSSFYDVNRKNNKSKVFEESVKDAIEVVVRKNDLSNILDYDKIFNLIDKYPEISWSDKQIMKENIVKRTKDIKMVIDKIKLEILENEETPLLEKK